LLLPEFLQEFTMENSEDEAENGKLPLELEPLRSLAPKFPTILGYDVETQSTNPLLVYATPFITTASRSPSFIFSALTKVTSSYKSYTNLSGISNTAT
jgi:hypothetical protein